MKKIFSCVIVLAMLTGVILPAFSFVHAQESNQSDLIPSCEFEGKEAPCQLCHLYELANNIVKFATLTLAIPILVFALIYGGFMMLTGGGSPERLKRGKSAITSAVIGILIIFTSFAIISTVLMVIGFQMPLIDAMSPKNWYDFPSCDENAPLGISVPLGPCGKEMGICPIGEYCVLASNTAEESFECVPITTGGVGGNIARCTSGLQCGSGQVCVKVKFADQDKEQCEFATDASMRRVLMDAGVSINKACGANKTSGTCLDGMSQETLDAILDFKDRCGCNPEITGGSEHLHSGGERPGSHGAGDKVDYSSRRGGVTEYIQSNFDPLPTNNCRRDAPTCYRDRDRGAVYYLEDEGGPNEHWDVCYSNC